MFSFHDYISSELGKRLEFFEDNLDMIHSDIPGRFRFDSMGVSELGNLEVVGKYLCSR